uniref:bcl-2-like protein 1 isoform X2 n=1 Tax=Pristiophorus japonicus TaxID=55135 RepID=UPI00398E774D
MYSSGELVRDFLRYKLSQRGHSMSRLCEHDGAAGLGPQPNPGAADWSGRPEAERACQALRDAAEEFELRYRRAFSDLSAQLRVTPDTAYRRFEQVVGELFRDGVNWGRLVAFFCFGAALSVESAEKEMGALVPRIARWMSTYLESNLEPWIRQHGGWHEDSVCEASVLGTGHFLQLSVTE